VSLANLIFLGTAGSSAVVAKQLRASGGIIFQLEDLQFHLDPGPGALVQARECKVNVHHTTAVGVSHCHINHCNDLNAVIDAMTHGGIEHRGVVLAGKSVLQHTETTCPIITKHHQQLVERIIPLEKDHKVGIELVEINALPAEHSDPTAIGFKFFCPRFTFSYTGDTEITDYLLESLAGTDILVMNVPYPSASAKGMNLDTEAAIKMVSYVRPKLAVITHFGLEMLKADPLLEAREIQRITGVQTLAARDGLAIAPSGFGKYTPVKGFS
jgi:ribonuclease BN (tRNA processing enzyme)